MEIVGYEALVEGKWEPSEILGVSCSCSGNLIAVAHDYGVDILDITRKDSTAIRRGPDAKYHCIFGPDDRSLFYESDGNVFKFDLNTGEQKQVDDIDVQCINGFNLSRNLKYCACWGDVFEFFYQRHTFVFDAVTLDTFDIELSTNYTRFMAFPEGMDNKVMIFCTRFYEKPGFEVYSYDFISKDAQFLHIGGSDIFAGDHAFVSGNAEWMAVIAEDGLALYKIDLPLLYRDHVSDRNQKEDENLVRHFRPVDHLEEDGFRANGSHEVIHFKDFFRNTRS